MSEDKAVKSTAKLIIDTQDKDGVWYLICGKVNCLSQCSRCHTASQFHVKSNQSVCPRLCLFSVTPVDISYILDSTCMCLSMTKTSRIKVNDGLSEATKANTIMQLKERYPDLCAVECYSVCAAEQMSTEVVSPIAFRTPYFEALVSALFSATMLVV